jgi:signal transduction histidine kinase
MKPIRARMRAPGNLTAVFLAVAGVSVFALVWLGVGIVRQDRALEIQRLDERREGAADRLVTALERALSADERLLDNPAAPPAGLDRDGRILIVADSSGLQVWPERSLLFYPSVPPLREAPAEVFRAAETLEYADRNSERAIGALRQLSTSLDPAVKAGANLRLARNLRKAGRAESALKVYTDLATVTDAGLSGVPADLVARRARCALLEQLGRTDRLHKEAQALAKDLQNGRWRLDRAAWHYYGAQVRSWLGTNPEDDGERLALAEGVDWVWQRWQGGQTIEPRSSGRRALEVEGVPVTVLWRTSNERLVALVASTRYEQRHWFEPTLAVLDRPGVGIALLGEKDRVLQGTAPTAGARETRRLASATSLPWTIVAWNTDVEGDLRGSVQRRRLIVVGLGALGLLVVAASYLIGRAVSRELAAARLQSDFVSAVSHEFRTPLTSLAEFTEILTEHEEAPVEKRRVFHEAQARATRRLTRLVESLLDFGRMEAGARPYRLEPLDAADLAANVVHDFRQDVDGTGFTIDYASSPGGEMVKADRDALAQALWNLLDNAVKYSGESRTVRVEVKTADNVAIRVRDSGYGIAPSEQKEIFRKFTRGAAALEHGVKGTGIGLAMVKHIVDAHGGKVTVESEPGRGSTFTIVLPTIRDRGSGIRDQGLRGTNATTPQAAPPDPRSASPDR